MFRLYEPAFEIALEEWGRLSKRLHEEKENIQTIVNTMSQAWVGETQRDNENILRDMVTTGLYQQTAEIVEKVYRIQYDLLPKIIAQMARCEKLPEQLEQDDYIPPYLGSYGYYNDGHLTLDEDYVAACNAAATGALEQAEEMRKLLYRAMDACDGLIDFSEEREMLEAGYRKVKRIENFQQEFNRYVIEVKEIEEELITGFRAVMAADPDPTNRKWNLIMQNLNNKGNTGYTLQLMNSVGMPTAKLFPNMKQDFFMPSPELQYLIDVDDSGQYTYVSLLQKDTSELTEAEIADLKALYQEICTSIEQANPNDSCFIQNALLDQYLTNLYKLEKITVVNDFGNERFAGHKIVSNDELIAKLFADADAKEDITLADNILHSIQGSETVIENDWYSWWGASAMIKQIETQRLVDVSINLTEVGCTISVVCCPEASNREKHMDEGVAEYYVTGEDRINGYINSLSPSEYSHLTSLDYDKEQLNDMLEMTQNKDDFQMVKYLMAGNEKDVFTIAPESYSEGGKNILASYAIKLGISDIDSGGGLQNLENFTNHMLSPDNWHEKEYMDMLSVYCGFQRDAVAQSMWESQGLDLSLIDKMEKVNAITGYYQSLAITGYDMQLDYTMLTKQKLHILVEDLIWKDGFINYTVVGYNQTPNENSLRDNIVSEIHWSPLAANTDLFIAEMDKINEQIQELWKSYAVDTVISTVGLIDDNAAKALELSKAMYEESLKDGLSAVTGFKAGDKKLPEGVVYAADVFGKWNDYYQKKEQLEADYKKMGENSMVSWFYSSNAYIEDGAMEVYNTGIYNGYTIEAIKEWNQNGLASFCSEVNVKDDLGDIFFNDIGIGLLLNRDGWHQTVDLAGYSDEEITNAMLLILYGKNGVETENGECYSSLNSITEIEPRLFTTCVSEINRRITNDSMDKTIQDFWHIKRSSYGEEKQDET